MTAPSIDGASITAVVKEDCPTCRLVEPLLQELLAKGVVDVIHREDEPEGLETSYRLGIETVPTSSRATSALVGLAPGPVGGVHRRARLGRRPARLPARAAARKTLDPGVAEELAVRFRGGELRSRRVELGELEDEVEAMFDRGWTDGLPVVPPTEARVLRMLDGHDRAPDEVVAVVPPDLVECTVEKVAVNAVMAGCRPEYLPVVLAVRRGRVHRRVQHARPAGHDLLLRAGRRSSTGPIARAIGMNSGGNALGQGNRANATIGRALQLVVRNVGGGRARRRRPGHARQPGQVHVLLRRGRGRLAVGVARRSSGASRGRRPPSRCSRARGRAASSTSSRARPSRSPRSLAAGLRSVAHPKLPMGFDAFLVVSPEHARVFAEAGWSKARVKEELHALLQLDGADIVRGAGGIAEGVPEAFAGATLPKFRPDGLLARARRRRGRPVLGHHRRVGQR